jgi:hypothetical protein
MGNVDLELQIASQSKQIVLVAALLLVVLVIASVILRDRVPKLKPWLFGMLGATLIIPTLFMIFSTIFVNSKSESGGPVHWHAGIEVWACGTELELRNPSGLLSNKVGTSTYHEHNDKYIHLEGNVMEKRVDASLKKFMRVTGGNISKSSVGIPLSEEESTWIAQGDKLDGDQQGAMTPEMLNDYIVHSTEGPVAQFTNSQKCNDSPAELQTFVYKFNATNNTYSQRKLSNPSEYIMSEESSLGPPSDCVIVEFDTPKDKTDKLCEQYGVKDADRCLEFGVKADKKEICNIREVAGGK